MGAYDVSARQLRTTTVVGTPGPRTTLSAEGVWGKVYDPATGAIRVVYV